MKKCYNIFNTVRSVTNYKFLKKFTGIRVDCSGSCFFYKNGLFHNENGPAVTYFNNLQYSEYYLKGSRYYTELEWLIELNNERNKKK